MIATDGRIGLVWRHNFGRSPVNRQQQLALFDEWQKPVSAIRQSPTLAVSNLASQPRAQAQWQAFVPLAHSPPSVDAGRLTNLVAVLFLFI